MSWFVPRRSGSMKSTRTVVGRFRSPDFLQASSSVRWVVDCDRAPHESVLRTFWYYGYIMDCPGPPLRSLGRQPLPASSQCPTSKTSLPLKSSSCKNGATPLTCKVDFQMAKPLCGITTVTPLLPSSITLISLHPHDQPTSALHSNRPSSNSNSADGPQLAHFRASAHRVTVKQLNIINIRGISYNIGIELPCSFVWTCSKRVTSTFGYSPLVLHTLVVNLLPLPVYWDNSHDICPERKRLLHGPLASGSALDTVPHFLYASALNR